MVRRIFSMGNNNEDKLRALDAALGQIEKQYGKGAVMKLGDSAANMNVETIPTAWISHSVLAVCRREESSRYMDRSLPVKQP